LANITESEEIDEAMNNSYLLMLAQQLKEVGATFKSKFSHIHWAWDEIDSSNIKNFNWRFKGPDSKALTAARNVISDRTSGLILTYRYENGASGKMKFMHAIDSNKNYMSLTKSGGWQRATSTELLDKVSGSYYVKNDGMVIIYFNQELTTYKKRSDRFDSRKDMVLNTPEYYNKIARENVARYKKIIEANRANNKSKSVEKLQAKVNGFLQDIMKATQNVAKNPIKYQNEICWMDTLMAHAYSKTSYSSGNKYGYDGVLILFETYMDTWARTATGQKAFLYGTTSDQYLDSIEKKIIDRISAAQHYLNKFDV
jgi:hypothetical protein